MNTHKNRFRVVVVLVVTLGGCAPVSHVTGWKSLPEILSRIKAPEFPTRDFVITDYGAVAGGSNDCTATIAKAIDACHAAGGGRVVVPDGVFLTGAIHLKSNVNLHLADGATLKFSADPAQYLPVVFTRWEGVEGMNYSALIYAFEQKNIAITGKGVLDGSASSENWWAWTRRDPNGEPAPARRSRDMLNDMGERGVPVEQRVFGQGHFLRPNFVQPYRCRNVLIEGVTIRNSPMWELNPVLCSNVTVRGVTISIHGPNNDGCDPESCRDVLIEDCIFDTGDDCIAIKSGRNNDGRRVAVPSENIIVRNCTMRTATAAWSWAVRFPAAAATCSSRTAKWTARTSVGLCASRTTRAVAASSRTFSCATSRSDACPKRSSPSTCSTKRDRTACTRRSCATSSWRT